VGAEGTEGTEGWWLNKKTRDLKPPKKAIYLGFEMF